MIGNSFSSNPSNSSNSAKGQFTLLETLHSIQSIQSTLKTCFHEYAHVLNASKQYQAIQEEILQTKSIYSTTNQLLLNQTQRMHLSACPSNDQWNQQYQIISRHFHSINSGTAIQDYEFSFLESSVQMFIDQLTFVLQQPAIQSMFMLCQEWERQQQSFFDEKQSLVAILFDKQLERDQLQVSFDNGTREVNEEINHLHQLEKLIQEQESLLPSILSIPSIQEGDWRNDGNNNDDDEKKEEKELEKLLKHQQEIEEQLNEMKQELNSLVQKQQSLEKPSSSSYVFHGLILLDSSRKLQQGRKRRHVEQPSLSSSSISSLTVFLITIIIIIIIINH